MLETDAVWDALRQPVRPLLAKEGAVGAVSVPAHEHLGVSRNVRRLKSEVEAPRGVARDAMAVQNVLRARGGRRWHLEQVRLVLKHPAVTQPRPLPWLITCLLGVLAAAKSAQRIVRPRLAANSLPGADECAAGRPEDADRPGTTIYSSPEHPRVARDAVGARCARQGFGSVLGNWRRHGARKGKPSAAPRRAQRAAA